ncbi:G3E family GTPase [Paenalcaligenes hominis]|uniref:G3E family GTPase n=1 Tax=Paenalcaligenes hominis TaxID=643674 RepID=A0ABX0WQH8_9BURK|nr:GTP-binding protein [Paenalcaligenes hominis]NJB64725.1 G3E family GTPase [Paenalcaligenes hominis]GGE59550.1 hypothetical protein GCM10007278_04660 [Paenalcaligenes hominis]
MPSIKPIATTLLTGFLGSGKTTYLNQLLQTDIPARSIVLVNDFGRINIDASLIAYQDDDVIRLNNGCVCCTLGASMAEKLAEIGRMDPPPTALFMELSGVANAARVADMIRVAQRFELNEVRCFVDVSLAALHATDPRVNTVWAQQILSATHLVFNRLTPEQSLPTCLEQLVNQSVAQLRYDYAATVPPAPVVASPPRPVTTPTKGWHSVSFESNQVLAVEDVRAVLEAFTEVLYRAKGMLHTEAGRGWVVQWTKTQCVITPSARPVSQTQLVFIGMDEAGLEQLVQRLHSLQTESVA